MSVPQERKSYIIDVHVYMFIYDNVEVKCDVSAKKIDLQDYR